MRRITFATDVSQRETEMSEESETGERTERREHRLTDSAPEWEPGNWKRVSNTALHWTLCQTMPYYAILCQRLIVQMDRNHAFPYKYYIYCIIKHKVYKALHSFNEFYVINKYLRKPKENKWRFPWDPTHTCIDWHWLALNGVSHQTFQCYQNKFRYWLQWIIAAF